MWKINSLYFKNACICWNKAVRRIVNIPNKTHTWMLGPILYQTPISTRLIKRCISFLFNKNNKLLTLYCNKHIVNDHNCNTIVQIYINTSKQVIKILSLQVKSQSIIKLNNYTI